MTTFQTSQSSLILGITHNNHQRKKLFEALKEAGCRLTVVDQASQVVTLAKELSPDIILLDGQAPNIDGFVLAQALQAQTQSKGIPLIIMAKDGDEIAKRQAFNLGVTAYLIDPILPQEILVHLQSQQMAQRLQAQDIVLAETLRKQENLAEEIDDFVSMMAHNL